jgi:endoglucanase
MYAKLEGELLEKIKNDNGYFNKAVLEEHIMIAKKVADEFGLPLYCGEFGCFPSTPIEDRVRLYADLIDIFIRNDIAWTHWNYKNDFPVVDAESLEPISEIVDVLTGK